MSAPPTSKKRPATRDLTRRKSRSSPRVPPTEPTDPDSRLSSHGDLTAETQNGFTFRLSTRLRECLVAEKYSVEAEHVENFFNICEAEVVPFHYESVDEVPSWQIDTFEELTKLCVLDRSYQENRLKLHRSVGRSKSKKSGHVPVSFIGKPQLYEHSMSSHVSNTAECPRFNVLWLSPTVFISPLVLEMDSGLASDDCVRPLVIRNAESIYDANLEVYSISAFKKRARQQDLSPLPFVFLRSMIKKVPVHFFSDIHFDWNRTIARGRDFPPSLCLEFLSIFPSSSTETQAYQERRDRTRCTFYSPLNKQQSRAILSSPLLTDNGLCLNLPMGGSFGEESVHKIPAWNAAFRESRTLRHVHLPSDLSEAVWDKKVIPFTSNSCIESLTMWTDRHHRGLTFILDGITTNAGIKCVNITHSTLAQPDLQVISYLLCKVLPGHPSLKEVFISVKGKEDPGLDRFVPFFAEWSAATNRINLVHFSIVHSNWRVPVLPSPLFQEWWDKNMVPILARNWYKNEQQKSKMTLTKSPQMVSSDSMQERSNLLLQVQGVNRGNVYRMITAQVAISDPTTANAGLLFEMLQGHFCLP
jgi:hypothetical protein